ncbi:MAG: DUF2846 domain-containing protein [Betaproteobacteria bacterium]|nr:DUF2846 domain-containing protein [Betaproteobacteria bacterium]
MRDSERRLAPVRPALLVALGLLAGCASTPQGTRERDAEAKEFVTHPATAAIYVYRSPLDQPGADTVLYVDHRLIGSTLPGGFFRVDANPGKRRLHGIAHDQGVLEIEVRPGDIYFVALTVLDGTSHYVARPAAIGRAELLDCCVLLENWAPGQRPLLR